MRVTFTFMHLAAAFIQRDLQCIQAVHLYCQYVKHTVEHTLLKIIIFSQIFVKKNNNKNVINIISIPQGTY